MHETLIPCLACARHLRRTARVCPFCDAAVPAVAVDPNPDDAQARGHSLRRAGVVTAVSLAAGFSLSACYGAPPRPPSPPPNETQQGQSTPPVTPTPATPRR